jgi:uncharacterized protein (TIGR02246 family)
MKYARALLLVFALAACDPEASLPPASENNIGDTIRAQETAILAAAAAEDATAVAAFYAPDAQMLSPGVAHTTPEAIRAAFQGLFDDPNGSLSFQNSEVITPSSGDYAVSQGTYLVSYSDPTSRRRALQSGNYIDLWRRQEDGSWKIVRDITAPSPEQPPSP